MYENLEAGDIIQYIDETNSVNTGVVFGSKKVAGEQVYLVGATNTSTLIEVTPGRIMKVTAHFSKKQG